MKRTVTLFLFSLVCCFVAASGFSKEDEKGKSGEVLFKENCSPCHPDGGNIINPKKTLHKKDREANKVLTAEDIVKLMRNPGPGMLKFDEMTVSEKDAKAIAEYIIKTF
ncbi:MAG TPA: c-type cytochrome [Thermodesulfovibrionales bacterium]|nr:c-type cytochrome [Thermodesulfovibrionales bacterium]